MEIIELRKNNDLSQKESTVKAFSKLEKTLAVLREIKLSEASIKKINYKINMLNSFQGSERKFRNKLLIQKHNIVELARKDNGFVPEKYYQNQWFVLGMSLFGMPIGLLFSLASDNIGLLGIGLPIGMLIGYVIGKQKDENAKKEGKQLIL
jgi:hypothetical protein